MKHFFFLFIFFCSSVFLTAQIDIQVGTGTGSTSNVPVTSNFGYNYTQHIYLASEITAAGGVPTYIHKIRYYTTSNPPINNDSWTVYMKNTTRTMFASTADWEAGGTLTQVFTGTVTFPAANNWMEITLTTPFLWDGVNNILIAVDENTPNWGTLSSWRTTSTTPNFRSIYYRNDATNPDPLSPPTATGRTTSFPNIQFVMADGPCSGTPVHDTVQVVDNSVCIGDPLSFITNANNLKTGINYQWQYDTGLGWTNFTTAPNTWMFTTTELTQTGDVRAVVTCTNSSSTDTTDAVHVTVNPLPVITINPPSYAFCSATTDTLVASGANTYVWSPATYLNSTTTPEVLVSPISSLTYTVTGTSIDGCIGTSTAEVNMITDVVGEATVTPEPICTAGPVDIEVSGLPAALSGGGSYEYRLLAEDGITVLQNWGPSSTLTFIPPADSEYIVFYEIKSTACPFEYVAPVQTNITVGFGADVITQHYNCIHPEGIFTLENIFGQSEEVTIYTNPFDSAGGLVFTGIASINGGRAVITPSQTGVSGSMLLDVGTFTPGLNNSLEVSFLLTADMPINNFGTGGGDGLTYSFGDDAIPGGPGPLQNGKGSKLRLCFDAANNGTDNGNATGIYLVYGWTDALAYGPASAPVLAYSSNTSLWKFETDVPVVLTINTEGKVTVKVNGTEVFTEIPLPPSYITEDVTNWNHLITAATGGDALRHAVDDFNISTYNLEYGIVAGNSPTPPATWQQEPVFDGLTPGEYTLWIADPGDTTCSKNLGVFEILNTNPVADLGNDTTICNGDSLTLDAQNPGASYLWSGSGATTQTIDVFSPGSYAVTVIDSVGCIAVASISVDMAPMPSADGIYASGSFPTVFFSVMNPVNALQYNWNFGDGNTLINASSSVGHTYASQGPYTVFVTVSNSFACDSVVLSKLIIVDENELSINNEGELNVKVYPNPATDLVNIILDDYLQTNLIVTSVSGAVIFNGPLTSSQVNVSEWTNGVYFLRIQKHDTIHVVKITVNH